MSEKTGVARAAGILMVSMILSRILGYLRDVVIYAEFGQNRITDAYNAAFSIPDFLYMLLVGGALSSAFIPVFASYLSTDREEEAWEVASIIFNLIMTLMLLGILVGMVFTPQLIEVLVPGFSPEYSALTVKLTRIMFAQALFMGLSGLCMGVLNAYKHFLMPAIGSVLYNLTIVVLGWILAVVFDLGIMGFSIGVVVGAVANFSVQVPKLLQLGLRYRFAFNLRHPGVKKIFALMGPVLIGLSVTQFNLFVNQNLASTLPAGIVAALRTGQRIMQLPIGIFAVAVAVAIFPTLTEYSAKNEMDNFKRTMSLGTRSVIFLTLPAAVGLIVLRVPIVRLLFEQGEFTHQATLATAHALLFYSIGLFGYSAQQVLNRTFYSIQDTITPVVVGVMTIVINLVLNFTLIGPMGHGGLALAYSIAGIFNMAALLYFLRRKIGSINGRMFIISFFRSLSAALLMGVAVYITAGFFENNFDMARKVNQLIQVVTGVGVGFAFYMLLALLFKSEEVALAWSIFSRRFHRKPRDTGSS
jgi:putative peptidoglycan lipid II flippase